MIEIKLTNEVKHPLQLIVCEDAIHAKEDYEKFKQIMDAHDFSDKQRSVKLRIDERVYKYLWTYPRPPRNDWRWWYDHAGRNFSSIILKTTIPVDAFNYLMTRLRGVPI